MARYRIDLIAFDDDDPRVQGLLSHAHAASKRPRCLCRQSPIPMYVAKVAGTFYLKRMPGSGSQHDPSCDSYEPPPELSGLGQVLGSAIREDVETGAVVLRLDFALTKTGSRAPPTPSGLEPGSVQTDGKKLSLLALLHYLWDQAHFNRWVPAMLGKRSWGAVSKHLRLAAQDKHSKGSPLDGLLFIPEPFVAECKAQIAARRAALLRPLSHPAGAGRKLMVLVADVKSIEPARYDFRLMAKHLPDFPFLLNTDLHKRLSKRYSRELALWRFDERGHLVVIATFELTPSGVAVIEQAALMNVNAQWLPYESTAELELLDALVAQNRFFTKGLRYNLPTSRPLASAVLTDTTPDQFALYVLPADFSNDYVVALTDHLANSTLRNWFWQPPNQRPGLPDVDNAASMPTPDLEALGSTDDAEDAEDADESTDVPDALSEAQ